jgi:hypothetical protein
VGARGNARDPLTGLLGRDAYSTRARQVLRRHGDSAALTRLFEITEQTAMRYVGTACPERTAKLPR